MQPLEPLDHHALGRVVDRGRVVAADAGAQDRLSVGAGGQPLEDHAQVANRAAALLQPIRQTGWNSSPLKSLG